MMAKKVATPHLFLLQETEEHYSKFKTDDRTQMLPVCRIAASSNNRIHADRKPWPVLVGCCSDYRLSFTPSSSFAVCGRWCGTLQAVRGTAYSTLRPQFGGQHTQLSGHQTKKGRSQWPALL